MNITIQLGNYPTTDALRKALIDNGHRASDGSISVIKLMPFRPEQMVINLVICRVKDLVPNWVEVRRPELFEKALEAGLRLCPAEVGPQLCLQYPNQPDKESVIIAMEPVVNYQGIPMLFCVSSDFRFGEGRFLGLCNGRPEIPLPQDDLWAFINPKPLNLAKGE